MKIEQAIFAFALSEKVKSGLIWASQIIELYKGLPETDRQGADKIIKLFVNMIANEIHLARKMTKDPIWYDVEKHIDMAIVMINSMVVHESVLHMTRALSHVTSIGQRSMTVLTEAGLI